MKDSDIITFCAKKISVTTSLVVTSFVILLLFFLLWIDVNAFLQFSRDGIQAAQWWRLVSGHFVHMNVVHGALNIAVFIVFSFSLGPYLSLLRWLISGVVICLSISLCLFLFSPNVAWYVGFSGVLHGLLMVGLGFGIIKLRDKLLAVVLLLLVAKIVREQLPGFNRDHLTHWIDGAVVVDAHLYGAIAGVLLVLFFLLADFSVLFVGSKKK